MSINREYLLADRSNIKLDGGENRRMKEKLSEFKDPAPKQFWINQIMEFTKLTKVKSTNIFNELVLEKELSFLRIDNKKVIYIHSTTPIWYHDKVPTMTMEN